MNSPSQATTAGGIGGYSTSLQNIPDLMKELSNFSNTLKPGQMSGLTSATTQPVTSNGQTQTLHLNNQHHSVH